MSLKNIFKASAYRLWQFYKAICPGLDRGLWRKALDSADRRLQKLLDKLGNAEKAHTLRVVSLIENDSSLPEPEKRELIAFGLVHDIGKAVTKPSLFFKVAKVLFKLNGNSHCIKGAYSVWRLTKDKVLATRVLRHHQKDRKDPFISAFQFYDDQA